MKEPPIPDMYGKIEEESTALGRLLRKIPGFDGYIERSRRREADQILRLTLAGRLEVSRLQIASSQQELSRDIVRAIEFAEETGRADSRLMGLIGKLRDAPQGYAGFFDAIKIDEEDLARIYAFDEAMLAYVDEIASAADALEKAVMDQGEVGAALRELDNTAREANVVFDSRQELLSGVSPEPSASSEEV
jgi:hypothetical protein